MKNRLLLILLVVFPFPLQAATQGTLGLTSTGSASISVTKSVQAQITDIHDMTLANWSIGDGAVTLTSNVCIYSSTGSYKVTATGSGVANAFTLQSGGNTLIYSVTWNSGGVGNLANTGSLLLSGVQSTTFSNADTGSATCSGGGANDTARVVVGITNVAMLAAASSATPYTGTLTMLITPF